MKNEEFALSKREISCLGKRLYEPSAKFKTQNSKFKIAAKLQQFKIQNSKFKTLIAIHKFRKNLLTNSGKNRSQIQEKFAHKFRNFYIIVWKSEIYALLEVKLGGTERIEEGATNLKELADKLDTTKMPAPSFMAVVIGVGQYAYKRKDGVYVIPIGCLKD